MLLNKKQLSRDKPLKGLPVSGVLLPVFLTKAEKQVSRESLIHRISSCFVGNRHPLWKHLVDRGTNAIHPLNRVIHITHMSGLPGLFVWKQKATTDAPDTLFNCNTKSQAKKNHRAMVVSSTAQNVKLCEANHADI